MIEAIQVWVLGALIGGTSLMFASLGGLMSERSGVVNIGLEGMMLAGAFTAAVLSFFTQNAYIGLMGALIVGGGIGAGHALLTQKLKVDHIISGVAINLAALGITNFAVRKLPGEISDFTKVPGLPWWGMSFLAVLLGIFISFMLRKTVFGLRMNAVGNDSGKAQQMGLNPVVIRTICVAMSGMLAGLGGAFLSIAQTRGFSENMTSGRGYIALAALIIGRWKPSGAIGAALAFGLLYQFEEYMQTSPLFGIQLPSEFWLSMPYILTLVAMLGFLGKAKPPADLGKA